MGKVNALGLLNMGHCIAGGDGLLMRVAQMYGWCRESQ